MGQAGQVVQIQVLLKVVVDVPADELALPAASGAGGIAGEGHIPLPAQTDEYHLQQVLAGLLVAREGF